MNRGDIVKYTLTPTRIYFGVVVKQTPQGTAVFVDILHPDFPNQRQDDDLFHYNFACGAANLDLVEAA